MIRVSVGLLSDQIASHAQYNTLSQCTTQYTALSLQYCTHTAIHTAILHQHVLHPWIIEWIHFAKVVVPEHFNISYPLVCTEFLHLLVKIFVCFHIKSEMICLERCVLTQNMNLLGISPLCICIFICRFSLDASRDVYSHWLHWLDFSCSSFVRLWTSLFESFDLPEQKVKVKFVI